MVEALTHRRAPLAAGVAQGLAANGGRAPPDLAEWLLVDEQTRRRALIASADECRYYGRDFSAEEMALLSLIAGRPEPLRPVESVLPAYRRYKPDGGLKDMMARVMLAMRRTG